MPWDKYSLTGRYNRKPKDEDILWKHLVKACIFMIIDIVVCLTSIISSFYIFVAHVVKPTERGFYCNDDSIRRPYYPNTVSTTNLLIITLGLPLPIFFFGFFFAARCKTLIQSLEVIKFTTFVYLDYVVGFGLSTFVLDFFKCFIGRLRPNFISMCKPDLTKCSINESAYLMNYVCQNGNKMGRNSRTSFPSGHAMAAVFCLIFLYYFFHYLHRNLAATRRSKRFQNVIMTAYLVFTIFCAITRVTDFWHHPSDVFGGIVFAVLIFYLLYWKKYVHIENNNESKKLS